MSLGLIGNNLSVKSIDWVLPATVFTGISKPLYLHVTSTPLNLGITHLQVAVAPSHTTRCSNTTTARTTKPHACTCTLESLLPDSFYDSLLDVSAKVMLLQKKIKRGFYLFTYFISMYTI